MINDIDTSEDELFALSPEVLETLLRDHTTGSNIFWATDSYTAMGQGYLFADPITIDSITGKHGLVLRPRALKSREEQTLRTKDKAEVFTPSWVCNMQNNLVDEAWFGRKDVFNIAYSDRNSWQATTNPISFPEGRGWKDYVRAVRLEVSCGEAPYLVSRYDSTTGAFIPLKERIGLLDRKLRVIGENTQTTTEWLSMAQEAYKSIYGFEWQGDNLLLAREAMLVSFIEYYTDKFGHQPLQKSILYIAYIISWNLWQMDGLRGVVPQSCRHQEVVLEQDLFEERETTILCSGCQKEGYREHNGRYCLVRDWGNKDPKTGKNNRKIRFVDLIKN